MGISFHCYGNVSGSIPGPTSLEGCHSFRLLNDVSQIQTQCLGDSQQRVQSGHAHLALDVTDHLLGEASALRHGGHG